MYSDASNAHLRVWAILLVDFDRLDIAECRLATDDFAKDGVLTVEMRRRRQANEELAAVGVWTFVGHAEDPSGVVAKRRADFIFKGLSPDAGGNLG